MYRTFVWFQVGSDISTILLCVLSVYVFLTFVLVRTCIHSGYVPVLKMGVGVTANLKPYRLYSCLGNKWYKRSYFCNDIHDYVFSDVKYIWGLKIISNLITRGSLQGLYCLYNNPSFKMSKTDQKSHKKGNSHFLESHLKKKKKTLPLCNKQERAFIFDKILSKYP